MSRMPTGLPAPAEGNLAAGSTGWSLAELANGSWAELANRSLTGLIAACPAVGLFLAGSGFAPVSARLTLGAWLATLDDEALSDAGMSPDQVLRHIAGLVEGAATDRRAATRRVGSLTIVGGRDKQGRPEVAAVTVQAGEIVCVVGPTGSGKSRLLGDVECLAQGDTPSGRRILLDGAPPGDDRLDQRLVAQLSQNMNFVIDLTVADFVAMHAGCRLAGQPAAAVAAAVARVIAGANDLTGEKFAADVSVTQLSGGQSRALMIADTALLSAAPVVLIDEIENAGVDRQRALDLLVSGDKIVLISTHDPLLALRGGRRLVIRNGGIADVIETAPAERRLLRRLERLDGRLMTIRDRLRRGERLNHDAAGWV